MSWSFPFFLNSILLGIGLAMDAFSVSLANGLAEPQMHRRRMLGISGVYGFFQALMPLIGWICVHTVVQLFDSLQKFVPWIAFLLLGYIGGKMLFEGLHRSDEPPQQQKRLGFGTLLVQGVATSIDALSVGFTIEEYNGLQALVAALLIAVVTWVICMVGLAVGKRFGTKLSYRAAIFGGVILIGIGLEILMKSFF